MLRHQSIIVVNNNNKTKTSCNNYSRRTKKKKNFVIMPTSLFSRAVLLFTLLVAAATTTTAAPTSSPNCLDPPTRDALKLHIARSLATEDSYTFRDGFLGFWRAKPSEDPNADYNYNNAAQPYGITLLYPRNNTPEVPWEGQLADIAQWTLSPNEVVVLVGCTPPPSRYFSVTPYLMQTSSGARTLAAIADPLSAGATGFVGDSSPGRTLRRFTRLNTSGVTVPHERRINHEPSDENLGLGSVGNAWNEDTAILISASPTATRRVANALIDVGFPPTAINTVGIAVSELGSQLATSSNPGGEFSVYLRNALPRDAMAYLAYENSPPWSVFSVTAPNSPQVEVPFSPPNRIEARGFDERYLARALDSLTEAAARALRADSRGVPALSGFEMSEYARTHSTSPAAATAASPPSSFLSIFSAARPTLRRRRVSTYARSMAQSRPAGMACITSQSNCGLGNRDTSYAIAAPFFRLPSNSSAVLVLGVSHEETGNAVYSNIVVNDVSRRLGIAGASNLGGASALVDVLGLSLPADVTRALPSLYAVLVARDCSRMNTALQCVQVPSTGWPSAPLDATLSVWERAYSTLASTVGPPVAQLVLPRLVVGESAEATGMLAGPVGAAVALGNRLPGAARRAAAGAAGAVPPALANLIVNGN